MSSIPLLIPKHMIVAHVTHWLAHLIATDAALLQTDLEPVSTVHYNPSVDINTHIIRPMDVKAKDDQKLRPILEDQSPAVKQVRRWLQPVPEHAQRVLVRAGGPPWKCKYCKALHWTYRWGYPRDALWTLSAGAKVQIVWKSRDFQFALRRKSSNQLKYDRLRQQYLPLEKTFGYVSALVTKNWTAYINWIHYLYVARTSVLKLFGNKWCFPD